MSNENIKNDISTKKTPPQNFEKRSIRFNPPDQSEIDLLDKIIGLKEENKRNEGNNQK